MRCSIAMFCLVSFGLFPALSAQDASQWLNAKSRKEIDRIVESEMESQGLAGVAVGVVIQGEIAYIGTYGKANIDEGRPVTEETVFNWASNSKPLMAVAAMQLVQAGKLELDADVRKYVPEFPQKEHVVTVRQLMCHQSGIPHYSNGKIVPLEVDESAPPDDTIPAQAMWRFANSPLIFEPGMKQSYSSYAYVLLSAVVESAGGEPINDQLHRRILEPAGMPSLQMDVPANGQENWTVGYTKTSAGEFLAVGDYSHAWKHGAGGYKSNVRDFAKWAKALLEPTLTDEPTESAMWTRQVLADGTESTYGLGFVVEGSGDTVRISHGGSQDETRTQMILMPRREFGVVVMCNTNHANTTILSEAVMMLLSMIDGTR